MTEEEYRRRRPHRSFKAHIDAEKHVIKCGKKTAGKLTTYVVASGLLYGQGETTFHSLFRQAWELKLEELPLYGNGKNTLPAIHVLDMAHAVREVALTVPPSRYLLAVDESRHTLGEITACISRHLGPGPVNAVQAEEALLDGFSSQRDADQLTLDQRFELGVVGEMEFEVGCVLGRRRGCCQSRKGLLSV